jgi:hypothetical protein
MKKKANKYLDAVPDQLESAFNALHVSQSNLNTAISTDRSLQGTTSAKEMAYYQKQLKEMRDTVGEIKKNLKYTMREMGRRSSVSKTAAQNKQLEGLEERLASLSKVATGKFAKFIEDTRQAAADSRFISEMYDALRSVIKKHTTSSHHIVGSKSYDKRGARVYDFFVGVDSSAKDFTIRIEQDEMGGYSAIVIDDEDSRLTVPRSLGTELADSPDELADLVDKYLRQYAKLSNF